MKWTVMLAGEESDLSALSRSLKGGALDISHDGQMYILSSDQFHGSDTVNEVRQKADEIISLLNGASRLILESKESIQVRAVCRIANDGKREIFPSLEPVVIGLRVVSPTVKLRHADGTVDEYHPADSIADWMPIALADTAVSDVLRIVAGGTLDWVNLYRIYEIVKMDVGGMDAITDNGWATKNSQNLFKHTANSPGAVGLEARHGSESTQPPPKPMTISEARSLISSLVRDWLRTK